MGLAEKCHHQMESSLVIAGISMRNNPLKPIRVGWDNDDGVEHGGGSSTTPTSEGSRIPRKLTCPPPPPKKRKASKRSSTCGGYNGAGREFFNPPDLDSVFIRRLHT